MNITKMEQKGKSEVYKIFVDDAFYCYLSAETIVKNKLKTGQHVEEDYLLNLKKQSDKLLSRELALRYVEKGLKTEKQVRDNLLKKGMDEDAILDAIDFLKRYNYVNDTYYAQQYILSKKSNGKNYLRQALLLKGIEKGIIDDVLESYETDEEKLFELTLKFIKNKPKDEKLKQKAYRHILSKGYTFDEAKKAVEKVLGENDDWN